MRRTLWFDFEMAEMREGGARLVGKVQETLGVGVLFHT